MRGGAIEGAELDHVAHAVPRWQDVWPRYVVELGADWGSGGPGPGFAPGQLRFADGARVEVLMPYETQVNDFLARFLVHDGPGPHHLTFKVPDLDGALDRVVEAGFEPIGVDRTDPGWMEAFIHPKQATGVVVQLAQAAGHWQSPAPDDFPTERRRRTDGSGPVSPASLTWVTHAVADLSAGVTLFVHLLGGRMVDEGSRDDFEWMRLTWGGPLGVRLISPRSRSSPTPMAQWLGGRSGRIHHLELATDDPEGLRDARPVDATSFGLVDTVDGASDGHTGRCWEIAPEDNFGLRLMVRPR